MTATRSLTPGGHRGRRYVITGPGVGQLSHVAAPHPGPGQALLRVRVNGMCASDLPLWTRPQPSYPVALGHEPVAEVVATGPGVDLAEGARVTGRVTGSMSDFVLADVRDLVPVPDGVDDDAALGEPLGCVVEALRRTPVAVGDRVVVIGLGFMGLCMAQLLRRTPAAELIVVDLRPTARERALALGADVALHPDEVGDDLRDASDVVVEATGVQAGLDLASELVRPHGTISILGYHQGTRTVDVAAWNVKAIDVVNAHVRDRDLLRDATRRGLALVAAGHVDVAGLITHRLGLEHVEDAFAVMRDRPDDYVKTVVDLRSDA